MPTVNIPSVALIIPTLGVQELMIILLIALLIFGGRKIPEIFKGLGEGIREFKTSMKGEEPPHVEKREAPKSQETKEAPQKETTHVS